MYSIPQNPTRRVIREFLPRASCTLGNLFPSGKTSLSARLPKHGTGGKIPDLGNFTGGLIILWCEIIPRYKCPTAGLPLWFDKELKKKQKKTVEGILPGDNLAVGNFRPAPHPL